MSACVTVRQAPGFRSEVDAIIKKRKNFFWDVRPRSLVDVCNRWISARLYGITVSRDSAVQNLDCLFGSQNVFAHPHKILSMLYFKSSV